MGNAWGQQGRQRPAPGGRPGSAARGRVWAQGPLFPDTAGGREGGCRRGEWQVRGQGFGRGSAGAFALSLKEEEDRGRGGRQDGGGQASARAVSPHRALRGSGRAAGRTERATPQAPLPVLPSPGGRFLDPSAGLAGAQGRLVAGDRPETGVRRPAPEAVGGGRLLGCGAEDGGASLGARSHLTCDR